LQVDAFGKSAPLASAVALLFAFPAAARWWRDALTTGLNARHGFAIAFSRDHLRAKEVPKTDEGGVYVSKDSKAKLLVGTMPYPTSERTRFGKVVDAIARTYTPGVSRTGNCDE
jgi:hypothetical protein